MALAGWRRVKEGCKVPIVLQHGCRSGAQAGPSVPHQCPQGQLHPLAGLPVVHILLRQGCFIKPARIQYATAGLVPVKSVVVAVLMECSNENCLQGCH